MFDFNASLNDVAPLPSMPLPVGLMKMEKSLLLIDVICVLFLLSAPLISSLVSVVFVFIASLIDVAPVFPMLLSVDLMRIEEWIVGGFHLCVVSFVFTSQIELSECCV